MINKDNSAINIDNAVPYDPIKYERQKREIIVNGVSHNNVFIKNNSLLDG